MKLRACALLWSLGRANSFGYVGWGIECILVVATLVHCHVDWVIVRRGRLGLGGSWQLVLSNLHRRGLCDVVGCLLLQQGKHATSAGSGSPMPSMMRAL